MPASNVSKLPRSSGPRRAARSALLSGAGRAGPRRLLVFSAVGASLAGLVAAITLSGSSTPPVSFDARMKPVDALPGGLHSTPEQDALADRANTEGAQKAQARGQSFTPPIAPSVAVQSAAPRPEEAAPPGAAAAAPPQPRFVAPPPRVYPARAVVMPPPPPPAQATPAVATDALPPVLPVAQQQPLNDAQQQQFNEQVRTLFNGWNARPPHTDVVLPPPDETRPDANRNVSAEDKGGDPPGTARSRPRAQPVSNRSSPDDRAPRGAGGQVLVPAGRGIYAHPVLALSSDQVGPAVFQADSGPIAGDRMIGSFGRENNRLVVRINTVIHQGQEIGAAGVVIAPDTMEASVASDVDQHYLERFALPAAAAFVQGLGAALATTSNTTAVLSPLGGATTTTNLNFPQQLGVGAGVAAANVGSTLNAAAPKGPTVTLAANVTVGVMFLSNVTYAPRD